MADHSLCVKWSLLSSMFSTSSQRRQDQTQVIIIFEPQRGWGCAELGSASPFKRALKHSNSNLPAQLEMWRLSTKIRHRHPNQHQTVLSVCFLGSEKYQIVNSKTIFSKKGNCHWGRSSSPQWISSQNERPKTELPFFFHVWESRNTFL